MAQICIGQIDRLRLAFLRDDPLRSRPGVDLMQPYAVELCVAHLCAC